MELDENTIESTGNSVDIDDVIAKIERHLAENEEHRPDAVAE